MNILQEIFTNYFEQIKYTLHPRATELENIEKMLGCGDPSFGGAMYGCPHCGKLKFVPFCCHSRFCPTCGNKYAMERTTSMSFKLIHVKHRHCVFTIDEDLRHFFLQDESIKKLYSWFYYGSPYFWKRSQMESPYPLFDFRRWIQ